MNDVEFLRQLSDMITAKIKMLDSNPAPTQDGEIPPVGTGDEGCGNDCNGEGNDAENPMDRDDTFVPPLQAKIEMMKKIVGIPAKDETLKQSQEQGGPAPSEEGMSPAEELKKHLTIADMFDDAPVEM